jgi:nicotinic acid mononucleotide adenylyltransferase
MIDDRSKNISVFLFVTLFLLTSFSVNRAISSEMTGVYWGAFDPPTEAHAAIIMDTLENLSLKKLIIVVNNHAYKNYTYPLGMRLEMVGEIVCLRDNVEVLWQDETHTLNFAALKNIIKGPICGIAGYDAYKKWIRYSNSHERACYDAIAVVPRGDDPPILFDKNAFLMPIDPKYKDVSSTRVKAANYVP